MLREKLKYLILALLTIISISTYAQIITTFAGTGSGGVASGDGGVATTACTPLCGGGSFDSIGNYYFGEDYGNPRIRKVTTAGIIYTVAGNGTNGFSGDGGQATNASISNVVFTVDKAGNIYIADYYNNRLRKVDIATGIINTICGNGIADTSGDGGPATAATTQPQAVLVDGWGNIFIDDFYKTRKINTTGMITLVAHMSGSGGMCFDSIGTLYMGSALRIMKIDTATGHIDTLYGTGTYLYNGDGIQADSANFRSEGIIMDKTGNIYLADNTNNRIRKIDTSGIIHTVAGTYVVGYSGDGGPATAAEVHDPQGVALDVCGNLYIGDAGNNRIRKVTMPPYFTIAAMADTICSGMGTTFNSTLASGGTASIGTATYQWYLNGTITEATTGTYTYTPTSGDSVRCVVTDITPCGDTFVVSSNTINMVTESVITPTITLSGIPYATLYSTVTVNATVASAGSSYSINWYNKGVYFTSTTVPVVTYVKMMAVDSITATVASTAEMCYDSALSAVHIVIDSPLEVRGAVQRRAEVNIFPNPAVGVINVACGEVINSVEVFDVYGRTTGLTMTTGGIGRPQGIAPTQIELIDIGGLPSGVYFVRVNGLEMARFVKMD